MELNTLGTFNFRLVTNQLCQIIQVHLNIIFPSGRKYNTAAAKMCALVEKPHIPNLSFMQLSSMTPPLPPPPPLLSLNSFQIFDSTKKEKNLSF